MIEISNLSLATNVPSPHFGKRINIKHLHMVGDEIKPIIDITW